MSVEIVKGDLFAGDHPAIGHGVNTMGVMGAGIAVGFKDRWPDMYVRYRTMCGLELLKPGDTFIWDQDEDLQLVCNLASQDLPGSHARGKWLSQSLFQTLSELESYGVKTFALPWIGCGIGGLTQPYVRGIVESVAEAFPATDITIVEL